MPRVNIRWGLALTRAINSTQPIKACETHGGPYGKPAAFVATYQDDIENFVFDFVLDTPSNEMCGDDRWVGDYTLPSGVSRI